MTDAQLASHVEALERCLLDPAERTSADTINRLLAEDFREIGASGREYDKPKVLRLLSVESPMARQLSHFSLIQRSDSMAFVTYRIVSESGDAPPTVTARCSLWIRRDDRWQMRYHQGAFAAP